MIKFIKLSFRLRIQTVLLTFLACLASGLPSTYAAFDPVNDDTDIFLANPNVPAQRPNVILFIDNTANWNSAFTNEKAALVDVIDNLGEEFNVGTMLFPETGGGNDSVDGGYVRMGVRQMTASYTATLSSIYNSFDVNADKGNNATPAGARHARSASLCYRWQVPCHSR